MAARPSVIVNVAQSLNGFIAGPSGRRVTISSPEDIARVHRLRSEVDAIIVGANTVICDDPRLLVDATLADSSRQPKRIVLDRSLRISSDSRILDTSAQTIIFTSVKGKQIGRAEMIVRDEEGLKLENVLANLHEMGVRKVLVEGGKQVITEFIEAGLIDEFYIFIGDIILEESGMRLFSPPFEIRNIIKTVEPMGRGVLISLDPYHLQRLWRTQVKDT